MNIKITSRKFRAKDSLKDLITNEVKSLEKFSDQILDVNVILSFTHQKDSIKIAEMTVQIPGKIITVAEETDDFGKSIIGAVSKVQRQLKKVKSKRISKVR